MTKKKRFIILLAATVLGLSTRMPALAFLSSETVENVPTVMTAPINSLLELDGAIAIIDVVPESQAEIAGIKDGDVIVELNDLRVRSLEDLGSVRLKTPEGEKAILSILRAGEKKIFSIGPGSVGVQLIPFGKNDPDAAYSIANQLASKNLPDDTFAFLQRALSDGYDDVERLRTDPAFDRFYEDPRWQTIMDRCQAALNEYVDGINRELYQMVVADQSDRSMPLSEMNRVVVLQNDKARQLRVVEMLESGEIEAADDFFNAAMILQHGGTAENYKLAHELALNAVKLGNSDRVPARWLAAAAKDRYLLSIGHKQWYGTQYSQIDGIWVLRPIDISAVTDEERKTWNVPTLEETKRMLGQRNIQAPEPPSEPGIPKQSPDDHP